MREFEEEVAANFRRFDAEWPAESSLVRADLSTFEDKYLQSYRRLTSLNAWRAYASNTLPDNANSFLKEAHNDAVSSHVFARLGSWRTALKAIRSCVENVLYCEYYKDHPVEMRLWEQGRHRLGFSEMLSYFRGHPDISVLPDDLTGLTRIEAEYATLSRAVHGSAVSFRMTTSEGLTNLWSADVARVGAWSTREKHTIVGLNLFLVALHRNNLEGTSQPGLRQAIALALDSHKQRDRIRDILGVNIPAPSDTT